MNKKLVGKYADAEESSFKKERARLETAIVKHEARGIAALDEIREKPAGQRSEQQSSLLKIEQFLLSNGQLRYRNDGTEPGSVQDRSIDPTA